MIKEISKLAELRVADFSGWADTIFVFKQLGVGFFCNAFEEDH